MPFAIQRTDGTFYAGPSNGILTFLPLSSAYLYEDRSTLAATLAYLIGVGHPVAIVSAIAPAFRI